jgi:hypothetical protein
LQRRNVRSALSCSRGVRRLRFLLSIMRSIDTFVLPCSNPILG